MSRFSTLPGMAGVLAWARKVVYGPGFRRAPRRLRALRREVPGVRAFPRRGGPPLGVALSR